MGKMFLIIAAASAIISAPAAAQVIGPSPFPAPGGTTFATNGQTQYQAGRVATYSGFDLSATGDLYFALTSHGLAMDGTIDETGETLVYDAATSNLASGIVNYTGFTNVIGSTTVYQTRLLLSFTDLVGNALGLTYDPAITTDGPLLEVLGDYRMTGGFQVLSGGIWVNADTFYNNAPFKPAGASGLRGSLGGSFYYTAETPGGVPEPATWAMMLVGFGGIGMAMRRGKRTSRLALSA